MSKKYEAFKTALENIRQDVEKDLLAHLTTGGVWRIKTLDKKSEIDELSKQAVDLSISLGKRNHRLKSSR